MDVVFRRRDMGLGKSFMAGSLSLCFDDGEFKRSVQILYEKRGRSGQFLDS